MFTIMLLAVFVLGYIAIAFEHPLRLNKAASAMITGVLCWTIYMFSAASPETVTEELLHHLGEIASILFFLLGAMTIVELIDTHGGFEIITRQITTRSKSRLLIIVVVITFFLSALLDNLTTAIVMASLCTRLLKNKEDKLWFCGMIVISANAGGAWSPLGDVTTTMLWIGGQITALNIMKQLILPSLVVCALPLAMVAWRFRGQQIERLEDKNQQTKADKKDGLIILVCGIGFLVFVPVFKTLTHLPPFYGDAAGTRPDVGHYHFSA
jgi:Na+/H+ antiporter NhaD/arsenite permease-like protein